MKRRNGIVSHPVRASLLQPLCVLEHIYGCWRVTAHQADGAFPSSIVMARGEPTSAALLPDTVKQLNAMIGTPPDSGTRWPSW